jgi:hypothetical protein
LFEYVVAGALVEMSLHTPHAGLLLGGAVAFALLAVTARGPLGVARVCGGRLHGALDVTVVLALMAAPILPGLRPGTLGVVAVEVVGVMWLRVVTLTRYTPTVRRLARVEPGPWEPADPRGRPGVEVPPGSAVARTLGLFAGRTARRFPDPPADLAERARQAGHRFRRLQRAWQARGRP